jgi:hypothetical protein
MMARPERVALEVPGATGVGAAAHVFRLRDKTVQLSGVFVGAFQLEGSIDGEDFEPIGGALTGPGFVLLPMTIALVRVRTVELTSGTPTAIVAGFDFRAL